ncbi:MAG: SDR family oxidoreductase [Acidiferrobacteraceae bacterium]
MENITHAAAVPDVGRPRSESDTSLRNRVTLVTGGARGLGAALCEALVQAGARVIAADVRHDLMQATAERLREAGHDLEIMDFDVSDERQVERRVGEIADRHGRIDIVINNAGIDRTVSIEEMSVAEWRHILAVNLSAPFVLAHHVFPLMRAQGRGDIVNIISTAAKRAWPNASAYHASKWGLLGLSHAMHVEGRPHGIRVTAVISGGLRTPFLLERFPDIDVGTLQDPANVADVVRYVLCQPAGCVIPEVMVLPMRETSWP